MVTLIRGLCLSVLLSSLLLFSGCVNSPSVTDGDVRSDLSEVHDTASLDWAVDAASLDGDVDAVSDSDVCIPSCKEGECGVDGCGGYCNVCATPSPYFVWEDPDQQVHYTLCDEATRTCVIPTADCEDGWCRIPAGSFLMGSNDGCIDHIDSLDYRTIPHIAVITRPFRMMATEVTIQEFMALMGVFMENPSTFPDCGPTCPITNISVWDAVVYANRKSQMEGLDQCYEMVDCKQDEAGHFMCERAVFAGPDCEGYRLPSFAEWQLAAGTSSDKCLFTGPANTNGCNLKGNACNYHVLYDYAWLNGHCDVSYPSCVLMPNGSDQKCCGIHPVGSLLPNPLGLYDTAGNVSELIGTMDKDNGGVPDPVEPVEIDAGYDSIEDKSEVSVSGRGLVPIAGCCWSESPYWASPSWFIPNWTYDPATLALPGVTGFRLVRTGW